MPEARWQAATNSNGTPRGTRRRETMDQATAIPDLAPVSTRRYVLAWTVMLVGLVGFWCCRPLLSSVAFNAGQLVVLLLTWKIASLICLPDSDWRRFTWPRLLAYCIWPAMQPRQFL